MNSISPDAKSGILLVTLGNRDLQFKDNAPILNLKLNWLEKDNDSEYYCINKRINSKKSFYEISKDIHENYYEQNKDYFIFPMIQQTIEYILANDGKIDRIIFFATAQNPPDRQDCEYIGKIAEKYFKEVMHYTSEVYPIPYKPIDFSKLVQYFSKFFADNLDDSDRKVWISVSGGTPDMRAAIYLAGIFREYIYLSIDSREKRVNSESFEGQRNIILKNIIEKMLDVYDYEGIRNLPVSENIKKICAEGLDLYNLSRKDSGDKNYEKKSIHAIILLLGNAWLCYKQGRYTDLIGRIFRIEEATWYLLFYRFLQQYDLIDQRDQLSWINSSGGKKKKSFQDLIKQDESFMSFLKSHLLGRNNHKSFESIIKNVFFIDDSDDIKFLSTGESIKKGKNFYYHFFKEAEVYPQFREFFEQFNKDDDNVPYSKNSLLNRLRNNSYLGHGFEGVTQEEVDSILVEVGGIEHFVNRLQKLLIDEVGDEVFNEWRIFDKINDQIKQEVEKQ